MCMALHTAEVLVNQANMISRGAIQVAVSKSSPDLVVTPHSSKIAVICTMKGEDSLAGASLSLDYVKRMESKSNKKFPHFFAGES